MNAMIKTIYCFSILSLSYNSLLAQELISQNGITASNPISKEFVLEEISGMEHPELIDDSRPISIFLQLLISNFDGIKEELDRSIGLDEEKYLLMKSIADAEIFESDEFKRAQKRNMCDSPAFATNLVTESNAQLLYEEIREYDALVSNNTIESFRKKVVDAFGEDSYAALLAWLNVRIKPGIKEVKIDHYKRDVSLGRDPFDVVAKFCD